MQGETLEQQFGEQEVCFRTLDLYTSAVLESTLNPVVQPKEEFRTAMDEMAKVCAALAQAMNEVQCQLSIDALGPPFSLCLSEGLLHPGMGYTGEWC